MNVPRLDVDVIARRLRLLRDTLDELEILRGATPERLAATPIERAAAERLLQVAVDLSVDINAHIAVALLGRAPSTGRQSFEAAAAAGAIDGALAERLAPAAVLRNVLVHRYTEIRLALVAEAIGEILDGFGQYVSEIAAFLAEHRSETI